MARLTKDNVQRARELIALYPDGRSALIPVLHIAQEQDGWLQPDAMAHVAELLDMTSAEVQSTATFYTMFKRQPVGTYLISICTNVACMFKGAYELLEHAESTLGVRAGGTTSDGAFSLEEAECIADCGRAPCLQVNYRYFGDVTPEAFDALVSDVRAGKHPEVPQHGVVNRARRSVGLAAMADVPASGEDR